MFGGRIEVIVLEDRVNFARGVEEHSFLFLQVFGAGQENTHVVRNR
jgi:hypothetical protein